MNILRIKECKSWKDATDSQVQHFMLARGDTALSRDPIFHKVTLTHTVKKISIFNSLSILVKLWRKIHFGATMSLASL